MRHFGVIGVEPITYKLKAYHSTTWVIHHTLNQISPRPLMAWAKQFKSQCNFKLYLFSSDCAATQLIYLSNDIASITIGIKEWFAPHISEHWP